MPFSLEELIKHINEIQGRKVGSKEPRAPSDSDRQKIESILKKLRVLRANPQLKFLMAEFDSDSPDLADTLAQFVGVVKNHKDHNLRIIDISGLPNEVSGPLTALISRLLFQYKVWQIPEERKKDPILFVCEEAHRYVPNHGEAQYKDAQESIRRIAKEGRKYGLGLMLVSQRPSDVESTVLSQCNTSQSSTVSASWRATCCVCMHPNHQHNHCCISSHGRQYCTEDQCKCNQLSADINIPEAAMHDNCLLQSVCAKDYCLVHFQQHPQE